MKKYFMLFVLFSSILLTNISSQPVYSPDTQFNKFLKELLYYQRQIIERNQASKEFSDLFEIRISNSLKMLRMYASICGISNTYKASCNDGTECQTSVLTEAGSLAHHWNEPSLLNAILNRYGSVVAHLDLHIYNL